jgi:hypothetical protein
MFKKITIMIISSLISFGVYAYQGEGFKIVSEKFTSTPGFGGGFVSQESMGEMKKNGNVYVNVNTHDFVGKVKEYIPIRGNHEIQIFNNTANTQRYTYIYSLACEDAYQNFERVIDMYAGGTFNDRSDSFGTVQKLISGEFPIIASTKITGYETASKEAKATLHVSR